MPKILVIDDDILIRETVKAALRHEGFEVATLEAPMLTAAVVKAQKPDAVILDLYMPGINGLDLCRSLKKDPETAKLPILIFTASTDTVDVLAGIQAGALEYVAKPVEPQVLAAKVRRLLKLPETKTS
jgi:two-component system alkaline phosphatase synthesis response regulator PhoP